MHVCCVYGAATPPGRLDAALAQVQEALVADGATVDRLAPDPGSPLWPEDAADRVAAADAVVLASPVYRASFPAVLKQLLDNLDVAHLHGKPVGLVVVGHSPAHHLAVRRHVADVLEWFGAVLVPTQVYCLATGFTEGRPARDDRTALHQLARTVLGCAEALRGLDFAPAPLAARAPRPTPTKENSR